MNDIPDRRLDRLAKSVARSGGISEDEVERIASNPFLNARVRARIEAERTRQAEQGGGWLITLLVATRAVAVLLILTIASIAAFWISRTKAPIGSAESIAGDVNRVVTGGTCALSATAECAISNEEVLATLFEDEGGNKTK